MQQDALNPGMTADAAPVPLTRRIEFWLFYVGAPIFLAVALPPTAMFPFLFAVTGAGLVLLHLTPGFRWRELAEGIGRVDWRIVALTGVLTAVAAWVIMTEKRPDALWIILRERPLMMVAIAVLYPLISALPQELVFRPLFFRRYAGMLPDGTGPQLVLNAALFSFAHLMYWSWIVALLTFVGGLAFGWSYRVRGSFAEAVILHSVAGVVLFAFGMGVFFYSGNVIRPF